MVHAIGDDRGPGTRQGVVFTPSQATGTLPLVRRISADMTSLHRSIEAQRTQLRGLEHVEEITDQANYADELRDIRSSLAEDEGRFLECLAELAALGVEPHLPIDGGIDFPAKMNRRSVRLCWHPEDAEVAFWHEIGQPREMRRRLDSRAFSPAFSYGNRKT